MSVEPTSAMPLVTVIVPSYNHARYLRDCLDSVLAQDYPNTEIIVVDDGSTDDSIAVLASYGRKIRLIEQRGGRQARARNLALAVARGEYVAFLDSDDRYLPGRLASAVSALQARPDIDLVWADYRVVDETGQVLAEHRWRPRDADFRRELIAGNPICNATVTVRRRALDAIGGFDERVPRACDGSAWYQLAARGYGFLHLDQVVLDYRLHGGNDSTNFLAMNRERDIALMAAAQAYVQHGVVVTASDRAQLRDIAVRQLAFRTAAWLQRGLSFGLPGQAAVYEALGSDSGLRLLSAAKRLKTAWLKRGRP